MKAVTYKKFGSPEVLQLVDIPAPEPLDNEVKIKLNAGAICIEDPMMRNSPGLNGILKPKHNILGMYIAGIVESVGKSVTRFTPGDKIYGSSGMKLGAYAEYICLPENAAIVKMPDNISFEEAAAIPNGLLTSLPFLRDQGRIKKGDKVLINGASGAVGTSAIQIAKHFETEVTAVCSTANLQLVSSLGADKVIDYTNNDFTKGNTEYDIIFDCVGKSSFGKCNNILAPGGVYLTTVPHPSFILRALFVMLFSSKRTGFSATGIRKAHKKIFELEYVNNLIEQGKYKAVIDKIYPLNDIVEAHKYVEQGHKKGNVVIKTD